MEMDAGVLLDVNANTAAVVQVDPSIEELTAPITPVVTISGGANAGEVVTEATTVVEGIGNAITGGQIINTGGVVELTGGQGGIAFEGTGG